MISLSEIDKKIEDTFGLTDFATLSNIDTKKRIELGQDYQGQQRVEIALGKAREELEKNFKGKELWVRIILWDKTDSSDLKNLVLEPVEENLKFSTIEDDSYILCYFFEEFDFSKIENLVKSSIYFDLGIDPSINMTCFYFNFKAPVIVNIYDDRGMDVFRPLKALR